MNKNDLLEKDKNEKNKKSKLKNDDIVDNTKEKKIQKNMENKQNKLENIKNEKEKDPISVDVKIESYANDNLLHSFLTEGAYTIKDEKIILNYLEKSDFVENKVITTNLIFDKKDNSLSITRKDKINDKDLTRKLYFKVGEKFLTIYENPYINFRYKLFTYDICFLINDNKEYQITCIYDIIIEEIITTQKLIIKFKANDLEFIEDLNYMSLFNI